MRLLVSVLLSFLAPCVNALADSQVALEVFKSGDYKSAIPLLQAQCSADGENVLAQAALLSALVYQSKVEEASDLSEQLAQRFPNSPEALAARGEFHYYMG